MLGHFFKPLTACGALLALVGCDHALFYAAPKTREPLSLSEAAPHPSEVTRIVGEDRAVVRTTVKGQSATGAKCRLISQTMSLEFFTPSEIVLPIMHHPMTPAKLSCSFGRHSGRVTLHARRKLETRDAIPDLPFGLVIGAAAELAAGVTDWWSYVGDGSTITIELAP